MVTVTVSRPTSITDLIVRAVSAMAELLVITGSGIVVVIILGQK